jgi:hypothetical protein
MKVVFVELPPFSRYREDYLDDDRFRDLQNMLLKNPVAGDVIAGTGGLRKIRYVDARRSKGKRGGLSVIYYWWPRGYQLWLFTLYDKDEMNDLSAKERKTLAALLSLEISARTQ